MTQSLNSARWLTSRQPGCADRSAGGYAELGSYPAVSTESPLGTVVPSAELRAHPGGLWYRTGSRMTCPAPPPSLSLAPPARLYFPVSSEPGPGGYEPLPSGESLAGFCLDVDAERPRYLAHKRSIARRPGRGPLRAPGSDSAAAIGGAEAFLRERMRELPAFRDEASRLHGLDLDGLLFELQEDLALMHLPPGHAPERTRALYLHVCFPGGWDPSRLIGKSFPALHARVPYDPGFGRSERAPHAAALFEAPAARYVWSVTAEPSLDRHPETPAAVGWDNTETCFLRVERQIMVPLPERVLSARCGSVSLFFIRTYVYALERLSRAQRATIVQAIANMSEQTRRYKGMLGHEARIAQLLSPDHH